MLTVVTRSPSSSEINLQTVVVLIEIGDLTMCAFQCCRSRGFGIMELCAAPVYDTKPVRKYKVKIVPTHSPSRAAVSSIRIRQIGLGCRWTCWSAANAVRPHVEMEMGAVRLVIIRA